MLKKLPTDFPLAIIEEAHTAFIIIDEALNLIYANTASELLLSQSNHRLHQLSLNQLAEHYHFNPVAIKQVFIDKGAFSESETTLLVDSRPVLVSLSASHLFFQQNAYVIIEMRCIEQQRKISQVHYQEHQQKATQELVRGLAHEIKNPLSGLRGACAITRKRITVSRA
ncbi:PAS domain-containing protein [Psychromonas sp. KJ10-10]|uniref:PAS domain-containing protein n=1 Tax=Psychromonas sp. KJ10-10 TaxID=3391823 RepID=UPI0039B53375